MAGRRLSTEESALWARVAASVRPIGSRRKPASVPPEPPPIELPIKPRVAAPLPSPRAPRIHTNDTLDGAWDKRLRQGAAEPDRTIDLHGHTLASAHAALDFALERAIADGARLLLVVTGRPPRDGDNQPRRGLIRAAIGDWLAASRHVGSIAAVRKAHIRHGGAGALYLLLRRRR